MSSPSPNHKIIGIGAVLVDELFYCKDPVIAGTSNPAIMKRSAGGVMRNIMHHLALLGNHPTFLTVTGDDEEGKWLIQNCIEAGMEVICSTVKQCSTGRYAAFLNPDGSLHAAASSNPAETYLNIELLQENDKLLSTATILVADTNLDPKVLQWLVDFCRSNSIKLFIEPVSVTKAGKLTELNLRDVFMVTPNEEELKAILPGYDDSNELSNELQERGVHHIWLRCGMRGSVMYSKKIKINLPAPGVNVIDSTGAGDAALAGWIAAYTRDYDETSCSKAGHALAGKVLESSGTIALGTSFDDLIKHIKNYYPGE